MHFVSASAATDTKLFLRLDKDRELKADTKAFVFLLKLWIGHLTVNKNDVTKNIYNDATKHGAPSIQKKEKTTNFTFIDTRF